MLWKRHLTFKWLSDCEVCVHADLRATSRAGVARRRVGRAKMKDSLSIPAPRISIIADLLAVSDGQHNFSETLTSSATDVPLRTQAATKSSYKSLFARHQNNHARSRSSSSSFIVWKGKPGNIRGWFWRAGKLWINTLRLREERGGKARDGWRWWWEMRNAHSCQTTCPSNRVFLISYASLLSLSPPFPSFWLFGSAWGASSGSDLTCHGSTVISPSHVTCAERVCVPAGMCVKVNVSRAMA